MRLEIKGVLMVVLLCPFLVLCTVDTRTEEVIERSIYERVPKGTHKSEVIAYLKMGYGIDSDEFQIIEHDSSQSEFDGGEKVIESEFSADPIPFRLALGHSRP